MPYFDFSSAWRGQQKRSDPSSDLEAGEPVEARQFGGWIWD